MSDKSTISVYNKVVAVKVKNKYNIKKGTTVRTGMKMLDSSAEKANMISDKTGVYYVVDKEATKDRELAIKAGAKKSKA